MALINIVPFDLNRSPGRPTKSGKSTAVTKTTATEAVHRTPEQRPVVNQGISVERRRVERRHGYKPTPKEKRVASRRGLDNSQDRKSVKQPVTEKTSIDIEV